MIKKFPKEKRDRLILIVVSTMILLAFIWQGLISMQKRRLSHLAEQRVEQEIKVSNAQRLVDSVDEIRANLALKSNELSKIEVSMASGDMYSWIITKVNQFKADYEVDIPQFSRELPTEIGMFAEFPYKAALFNIRGTAFYHDFGRFLADFENAFPYLMVRNVELEPAQLSQSTQKSPVSVPGAAPVNDSQYQAQKLAFNMEIVTLINPNAP